MAALKTFLSTLALGALLLLLGASPASAAKGPCGKQVVDDWYDNGTIDRIYPASCYAAALKRLPADLDQYSGARDEINRALLASIHDRGERRSERDLGAIPAVPPSSGGGTTGLGAGKDPGGGGGIFSRLLSSVGPKNAESIPLPLLVLAGIAFLLAAAAAASFVARRIQTRRLEVATVPVPQEPKP